eukprot:1192285-Prorocentrum_minimum.AAC.2
MPEVPVRGPVPVSARPILPVPNLPHVRLLALVPLVRRAHLKRPASKDTASLVPLVRRAHLKGSASEHTSSLQ